jgi:carboxyl-terminal processing protease
MMNTKHTHPWQRLIQQTLISTIAVLLAACGGGSSGEAPSDTSGNPLVTDSRSVDPFTANLCAAPRANTADLAGLLDQEKTWVRALMDKTYLWHRDVPAVDAAAYTAAAYGNSNSRALDAYFRALKTPLRTSSGKPVDEFSFTLPTEQLTNQQAGITSGYGMRLSVISNTIPRNIRVLYVESDSPAALAGISRGDQITSVDGVTIDDNTDAGIATINNSITPVVNNKTTQFGLLAPNAAAPRTVSVTSSDNITVTPVALTKTFTVGTQTVGYLVVNSLGINSAELQLFNAIEQLQAANIQELVLDIRYNGGGYLDISNQLAWMIGGSSLAGQVYERTVCNDKNPFAACNTSNLFQQTSQGFSLPSGQALPQLGLKRVFVLTSLSTCSASESVINGLAPFLQVIRIGSTTCGKPYGFYYFDNCGTSYAAMQFKGANALGFGDYADGFTPTCSVPDDLSKQRGDSGERMLSAALTYVQTGACPAVSAAQGSMLRKAQAEGMTGNFRVMRSALEEQRWYRTQH